MGVAHTNQLLCRHQHQRISPFQIIHGEAYSVLYGSGAEPLPCYNIGNNFCIAGGMENRARQLQFISKPGRIADISVMGKGHFPFLMIDLYGLAVIAAVAAGGSVPHMSYCHISFRQAGKRICGKHLADQTQILIGGKHAVIVNHNSTALLPPVLQGVQPVISRPCRIKRIFVYNTKHAAFFMNTHYSTSCRAS